MLDSSAPTPKDIILAEYLRQQPRGLRAAISMTIVAVQAGEAGDDPSSAALPDALAGRLGDFGFRSGEKIDWLGRAPFGEPYFFAVRGATVALRLAEAKRLLVRIDTP